MAVSEDRVGFFLIEHLRRYSQNFVVIDRANPIKFRLNGKPYSVHVSLVHDSGNTRPDGEERIQIQRVTLDKQSASRNEGYEIAFIGFFPDGSVFCAWEPEYVFSLKPEKQTSIYAKEEHYSLVREKGAAINRFPAGNLKRQSSTVSLRADALGFYLENIPVFHEYKESDDLQKLILESERSVGEDNLTGEVSEDIVVNGERRKVRSVRFSYPRDKKFTEKVLKAYNWTCAICNRQLNLVQAAHLVPHCEEDSSDELINGIALCTEHHKLYDNALLLPFLDQKLIVNEDQVIFLKETDRAKGLDEILQLAAHKYWVPDLETDRPKAANLTRGAQLRMGRDPQ
jgi:putative restriction endonuclease